MIQTHHEELTMDQVRRLMMPAISLVGPGAIGSLAEELQGLGCAKPLIVTDKVLTAIGLVAKLEKILKAASINYTLFDEVQPNPNTACIDAGLSLYVNEQCDALVSFGGGSPQDAAKAIGILATNGGRIADYEGINKSLKKSAPIIAINTTAGTASEVTINYVITNEQTKIKMVMVDKNCLASVAISDPELMLAKPADLTAATGMDALTHAVEAYLSIGAFELSDHLALKAIELIGSSLEAAVTDGENIEARSKMAWASYIAGLAFNNCGLGYVHSMAHQLGGLYDLPHGVCNAILLPHVERFNASACGNKLAKVADALGTNTDGMSLEEANRAALKAIETLSLRVGIPRGLKELGVEEGDLETMAKNALNDVCKGTNPRDVNLAQTVQIYRDAM